MVVANYGLEELIEDLIDLDLHSSSEPPQDTQPTLFQPLTMCYHNSNNSNPSNSSLTPATPELPGIPSAQPTSPTTSPLPTGREDPAIQQQTSGEAFFEYRVLAEQQDIVTTNQRLRRHYERQSRLEFVDAEEDHVPSVVAALPALAGASRDYRIPLPARSALTERIQVARHFGIKYNNGFGGRSTI